MKSCIALPRAASEDAIATPITTSNDVAGSIMATAGHAAATREVSGRARGGRDGGSREGVGGRRARWHAMRRAVEGPGRLWL